MSRKPTISLEDRLKYCNDGELPIPGKAHYSWHLTYFPPSCEKGKFEVKEYNRLRVAGKIKTKKLWSYDDHIDYCDDGNDPLPNIRHYSWHYNGSIDTCDKAFIEMAMYNYKKKHGSLEGWEHKKIQFRRTRL